MNEHFASDDSTDTHHKWKQLADLALADSNMTLAEDAAKSAGDLSGLLLMYSSAGNSKGVAELAEASSKEVGCLAVPRAAQRCGAAGSCPCPCTVSSWT